MRSEGFLFWSGGLGRDHVCLDFAGAFASVRDMTPHVRMAVPLGFVGKASHGSRLGGSASLGLVGRASLGWRRAVGIEVGSQVVSLHVMSCRVVFPRVMA